MSSPSYVLSVTVCDAPRSVWATGQDQCASIKRMLAAMLPGVSVFLDVRPAAYIRPCRLSYATTTMPAPALASSSQGRYSAVVLYSLCRIAGGSRL